MGTFGLADRLLWDSPVGWAYARVVPRSHAGVYADVAEVLALGADDDLLDIGCGPGAFLAEHAQQARTVTGLDPSRTMLREAVSGTSWTTASSDVTQQGGGGVVGRAGVFSQLGARSGPPALPCPRRRCQHVWRRGRSRVEGRPR